MASKSNPGQATTGRPPTTSVLRSALYYQNRIIVPEKKTKSPSGSPDRPTESTEPGLRYSLAARPSTLQRSLDGAQNSDSALESGIISQTIPVAASGNIDCGGSRYDAPRSPDKMETHGIDIVVTEADDGSNKDDESCLKRFFKCLQDNRMKGVPNAEEILASSNPQDFKVLKKVLNISFLTIGIALLIAVLIVILYSTIDSFNKK
ncbi:uncharacterized protein LOC128205333 [Mya arenaria]|uniref:uncharacterized protein LOC128205333 n=1 Tax=Mya arenaria TaxID=6604 RepID=UPI0022E2CB5C|nr:uncharacterized protein LOC128205333 [Mya arenaria]XP_052762859.1 uncharacterized protein LOC128205333 [Mya arenaria]